MQKKKKKPHTTKLMNDLLNNGANGMTWEIRVLH